MVTANQMEDNTTEIMQEYTLQKCQELIEIDIMRAAAQQGQAQLEVEEEKQDERVEEIAPIVKAETNEKLT